MVAGRRILLTGGAGFIGSHLAERLTPANEVVVFDNFRRDALRGTDIAQRPQVEMVEGDVLDKAALARAMSSAPGIGPPTAGLRENIHREEWRSWQ